MALALRLSPRGANPRESRRPAQSYFLASIHHLSVIPDDFTPSAELAPALRRDADDGRPIYEMVVPRRPIIEDIAAVPPNATFLATRGTAAQLGKIANLDLLQALWSNPASPELFRVCAEAPALRAIYVCHFKRLSEVPLSGAPRLEHLMLSWAPQLVDLGFLRDLPALRTIYLEDMKRVDLTTLPHLSEVTGFHLGGGMWSTLKVDSLEPLTRLPRLRYLRLSNVRPLDGELRPLGRLRELREIYLPNFFELEEVARLAGAFPNAKSNTLTAVFAPWEGGLPASAPYLCPQCGGMRQMMTGKPGSLLCPVCDASKYQRRVARWEVARSAGWVGSTHNAG